MQQRGILASRMVQVSEMPTFPGFPLGVLEYSGGGGLIVYNSHGEYSWLWSFNSTWDNLYSELAEHADVYEEARKGEL